MSKYVGSRGRTITTPEEIARSIAGYGLGGLADDVRQLGDERDAALRQRDEAAAEVERLRRRTHEIQEAADQRYSDYVQRTKGWLDLIDRADELTKEPGVYAQSAYMRATVAHLLRQRDELRATRRRTAARLNGLRRRYRLMMKQLVAFIGEASEYRDQRDAVLEELRSILAEIVPLLDTPLTTGNGTTLGYCFFCQNYVGLPGVGHAERCLVLRRDALLGRLGDGATGARPATGGGGVSEQSHAGPRILLAGVWITDERWVYLARLLPEDMLEGARCVLPSAAW